MAAPAKRDHILTPEAMNPHLAALAIGKGVRGTVFQEAQRRKAKGEKMVFCNTGNPHAMGQRPLTFPRQVLALVSDRTLLAAASEEGSEASRLFPRDVVRRAHEYAKTVPGGTGAYQDSRGNMTVRKEVAAFISKRDGFPADHEDVFLCDGASTGIQMFLHTLIRGAGDGIMLPVPQYPLYSSAITVCGGSRVDYYLDEADNWALRPSELDRAVAGARAKGITVRALVVINPGNPTGSVLPDKQLAETIQWCRRERVILIADEVYQTNVYGASKWTSFKRALRAMPAADQEGVELVSFHTVSKGVWGECGRRGGYMELVGFDTRMRAEFFKSMSLNLSTNVDGQLFVGMMCNPPQPGDESYESFSDECTAIFKSLERRAKAATEAFNATPGMSCVPVAAALYAFPRVEVPKGAVADAKRLGIEPDELYCLELLRETGICTVPGSGFGQADGTFHFRTTILPPEDQFRSVLAKITEFHTRFTKRYAAKL